MPYRILLDKESRPGFLRVKVCDLETNEVISYVCKKGCGGLSAQSDLPGTLLKLSLNLRDEATENPITIKEYLDGRGNKIGNGSLADIMYYIKDYMYLDYQGGGGSSGGSSNYVENDDNVGYIPAANTLMQIFTFDDRQYDINFRSDISITSVANLPLDIDEVQMVIYPNGYGVSTYGAADGSLTVIAVNGKNPLSYSIDDGKTYSASNVFNGLTSGSYLVRVKDSEGASVSGIVTITSPPL